MVAIKLSGAELDIIYPKYLIEKYELYSRYLDRTLVVRTCPIGHKVSLGCAV